ncbi:MAG TPA: M48 family metallopeptidase [Vicinamibacterales bacterium]|nr:M48 family metallopeptidase [Vicinamibacterales bacterium]
MNEDKATRYHRLGRQASILSTAWSLVLLSGLLLTGASGALRVWASSASSLIGAASNPSAIVAFYVLVLSLIVDAAMLPLGFYKGFFLERRYGLATETTGHWLKDHLKAVAIGLLFAEIGALFVYATLRHWPGAWWAMSGLAYSAVIIVLVNLAPVVLLPLFYTFKPLEKDTLRDRLTALAAQAGTSIKGVYEWTLSDRTKKANAALTGMGRTRRILLSDTLLAEYSDDEIEVILAHELAHHVHRDIWSAVALDALLAFAGFYAAHQVLIRAVPFFGLQDASDPAGIPVLLIAAGALGLVVKPLLNAVSRSHERRADRYALRVTRNPAAFLSAMRRLGQQNLAEENPSRLAQAFFYTHPPIKDRLRAAQEWAATLL